MSVPVKVERLREEVANFGPTAYLLTVSDDQRPHAVAVSVAWSDGRLLASVGSRTLANAEARSAVTLLWAPIEDGGYSLIVDGEAEIGADEVGVRPTNAVLHRPRPGDGSGGPPGSDCVRLG